MKKILTKTAWKLAPLAVLLLLAGCCPSDDRLLQGQLNIRFLKAPPAAKMDTAVVFNRTYAIGGRGNLTDSSRFMGGHYVGGNFISGFPVTLAADQTTYIFESATRTDTLTISYQRRLAYISRRCGAEVYVSNFRLSQPTTFKKVTVSDYEVTINL